MSDERADMPHASNSLLEVGDLLPSLYLSSPSTPSPEMGPTNMSKEEWLRELARRIGNMKRELELAERMLNSYAVLWERRNNAIKEDIKSRGDAL